MRPKDQGQVKNHSLGLRLRTRSRVLWSMVMGRGQVKNLVSWLKIESQVLGLEPRTYCSLHLALTIAMDPSFIALWAQLLGLRIIGPRGYAHQ